ncbi:MAG: ABC transporter ATP-binding protein [Desulfobacteraceae bacterium]|jgi:branched-chain amino acid transport system ATP-binding protein|nr:ABC transporter ATP-binding protein [Desulfobacteraceae bacterium]
MLKLESINTFYGKAQIIFDLSLDVSAGEVVVLLGRNGAGKTTTFKSIMGFIPATRGTITFNTQNILGWPPHKICALGVGYVPEGRRIFSKLTIMENLEVAKQPARRGIEPWTPASLFALFPNLGEKPGQYGGNLSGGEQQMLAIARTLMGNPELIILDEPSEGLAPVIVEQLAQTIGKLKGDGVAVLMAEQNLNFAKEVCDRSYIIQQGRIRHESAISGLSPETCGKYLSI